MTDKKITISMKSEAFFSTDEKEIEDMQEKINSVTKDLSAQQIKTLESVIGWVSSERILDENYNDCE